jgi:hypothetical protein
MRDDMPTTSDSPPSRALVLSRPPSTDPVRPAPRPLAAFLTQLFACEARLAPFRKSRRTGPEQGAASYKTSRPADACVPSRFERVL